MPSPHRFDQSAVMQGDLWLERIIEIGLEARTYARSALTAITDDTDN
jgi:hypothetical protein